MNKEKKYIVETYKYTLMNSIKKKIFSNMQLICINTFLFFPKDLKLISNSYISSKWRLK